MPIGARYHADPRHATLGGEFFDPVTPARFPRHVLRFRNDRWAARVGLETLDPGEWERHFARFEPLPDNLPQPLCLRYHGHQFRAYNPHLGDGRGFLFAQVRDADDQRLLDLGTKGSGQTPYSRGGDGRLTLKGGVREVLATEMLEALGVQTSKSFSLFETFEALERGDEPSPTRSSVLVRLGHSHVRFGTFQRFRALQQTAELQQLVEYSVAEYLPEAVGAPDLPTAFLRAVCRRSATLAASWIAAGFVHGVLNTDNMNVTGESFDYGPYRFLPTFDPAFVAAYFDHTGLYGFGRQPEVVRWNCQRLADTLTPIADASRLASALDTFEPGFREALRAHVLARLGLAPRNADDDQALVDAVFGFLAERPLGFAQLFFDWWGGGASAPRAFAGPAAAHYREARFAPLRTRLDAHAPLLPDRLVLPYFQRSTPRTLLYDEIEAVWARIVEADDWAAFERTIAEIRAMGAATATT